MPTAPGVVEDVLTTSEVEFVCAQNGVHARKTACKFSNPLNLYAIMAMEQVRRNRVILIEAVEGRLRKLGHPPSPNPMPVVQAEPVQEPQVARKPRTAQPKDDKEPIVNGPHTSERPCPKCQGVESRGAVFGHRKMKHTLKSGEVRVIVRRQSRCIKCRGGYAKPKDTGNSVE